MVPIFIKFILGSIDNLPVYKSKDSVLVILMRVIWVPIVIHKWLKQTLFVSNFTVFVLGSNVN